MFIILFRKSRGPWSTLRSMITRRQPFRRNAQTAACPAKQTAPRDPESNGVDVHNEATTQDPNLHATSTTRRDIPCCSDTQLITSHLAGLAVTVSRSTPGNAAQSQRSSSSSVMRPVNTVSGGNSNEELEEENFQYLRSLITVSCLSTHSFGPNSSPSAREAKDIPSESRKRASSRLSLRLGELPSVPFVPKVHRKPCPRYTCLPPAWTPRPVAIRPEVRF